MNLLIIEIPEKANHRLDFTKAELTVSPVDSVVSVHPVNISLKPVTRDIFNLSGFDDIEIEGAQITPYEESITGRVSGSQIIRDEEPSLCDECGKRKIYHVWIHSTVDHGAELCFDCLEKIYLAARMYKTMEVIKEAGVR